MVMAVLYFDTTDPDAFMGAIGGTGHLFENIEGFHGFELRRGVEDPNQFILTASWDSIEAHEAWQAAHAAEFIEALEPTITERPEIRHFT
jgi:heme-degrading monooxygenase HmoA